MALRCRRSEERFEMLTLDEHYRQKVYPQKYIFADEIGRFFGISSVEIVIVYQHLGRCMSHQKQIEALYRDLQDTYRHVTVIKHTPYSPRAFFFLCKSEVILESLRHRLASFANEHHEFWKLER